MASQSSARRRADRLATLHAELRRLIRHATHQSQADLFDRSKPQTQTKEAATASRTVTLSLREAADLFRAAMPPTAHDASTRLNHALLIVALRHLIDTLHDISSNEIPAPAIAAAELVGRQVRKWLHAAARSQATRARRPAIATAQTSLLLPLNINPLLRQKTTPLHNSVPVRSPASQEVDKPLIQNPQSDTETDATFTERGTAA